MDIVEMSEVEQDRLVIDGMAKFRASIVPYEKRKCEECEEAPAVLANGCVSRYCPECLEWFMQQRNET